MKQQSQCCICSLFSVVMGGMGLSAELHGLWLLHKFHSLMHHSVSFFVRSGIADSLACRTSSLVTGVEKRWFEGGAGCTVGGES